MQLILGSQSPRRREILSYFSLPFLQVKPPFDEESIPFDGDPVKYVKTLSQGKADSLFHQFPNSILLTADTIVFKDGVIFGKPESEEQAFKYLKELSGRWHTVYTGLTIKFQDKEFQDVAETRVLFNPLTDDQIHTYYRKLPYADKAGGYMIQKAGGIIIDRIEGCYYNVMGFPINSFKKLLKHLDIDLWDFLK